MDTTKFDLILKNGTIVDTLKRLTYIADVGIKDGVIKRIGSISGENEIDCTGKYVAAGFINAHVHIESSMAMPSEYGRAVIKRGTTSVISDPHEIVNVKGAEALDEFIKMCEDAPINIYTVVPSCVPATPFDTNGAGCFTADDMKPFVHRKGVVGLGEVMSCGEVIDGNPSMTAKLELFKDKTIDGHAIGMTPEEMKIYANAGISNDHECNSYEDVKMRLDAGLRVYIREGSACKAVTPIIKNILEDKADINSFAFCTDDKHLKDIEEEGDIDFCVRKAIALGMSPLDAFTIASLNPAEFYKLGNVGAVAEGYVADLIIIDSLGDFKVLNVIKNGRLYIDDATKTPYIPDSLKNTVILGDIDESKINPRDDIAIRLIPNTVLTERETPDKSGTIAVVAERHGKNGNVASCYVNGYGIKNGAVAVSVAHDSHNSVTVGDTKKSICVALNRLKEIGGGLVVVKGDKVVGELALSIGGLMSELKYEKIIEKSEKIYKVARELGINNLGIDPFLTPSFISLPVIPHIRLLDTGLFDVDTMRLMK